jgi:hybrid cluster-associated redox disulfide protein
MMSVDRETIVAEVLAAGPPALRVFLRRRMACPGCPMASYMTLWEAAAAYGIDVEEIAAELSAALGGVETGSEAAQPLPPGPPRRAIKPFEGL